MIECLKFISRLSILSPIQSLKDLFVILFGSKKKKDNLKLSYDIARKVVPDKVYIAYFGYDLTNELNIKDNHDWGSNCYGIHLFVNNYYNGNWYLNLCASSKYSGGKDLAYLKWERNLSCYSYNNFICKLAASIRMMQEDISTNTLIEQDS